MKIEIARLYPSEEAKVRRYAMRIAWGFTPKTIRRQVERFRNGSPKVKAKVLCLLEDCNYHTLYGILERGDYEGAERWIVDNMSGGAE